ncbi:choice-of-anchor D domain-containing protein [Hymenobacter sp. ASUV-10]|uniref:Choice-of-anchor D domain-containing protein n=1 Tax=Hymenobacter aranciens TaxID=3063996 RepID=A0ABT9BC38_9BACT|nr:choice-of-anchor D domain-containing protein [Hymenobacter sp. ASUV-10]MDO7874271.1 choice-of-anchor D domain-containing protein [Hymenobacter sp. ASUV-10]
MRIPFTLRQPALGTRLLSLLVLLLPLAGWAQVSPTPFSITGATPNTYNFDNIISTGSSNTGVPAGSGFGFYESPGNTTYTAGTGSSATGDTYSFGATNATDRALGSVQSGSTVTTIGAAYTNNTNGVISQLAISYTGEQWRLGYIAASRVADRLDFQYSTNATSLSTGTYVDFNDLDFTGPVTTGTVGALNGNSAANRTALSATIGGLSIAPGATFYIRWNSFDVPGGADDGLAVDEFSITATVINPTLAVTQGFPPTAYANNGTTYSFGSRTQGTASGAVAFTLRNNSPDPLRVSSITTTGDFAVSSTVPATLPFTVAAGDTAVVNVTFTPTATGARTGTLVINSNAVNTAVATPPSLGPYTVNLGGTGTAATANPEINVQQPAGTDYLTGSTFSGFASTPQGSTSPAVAFTIQNTSSTDVLTINSISTTGDFAVSGTAPTSVATNSSATVSVTFSPTATGPRTGTLVINSNDQNEAIYTINLSATGMLAVPTIATLTPNAVYGGATYSTTITGTDFGTAPTVNFNGASLTPSFVNGAGTSLTVALPVPAAGTTYPVTVTTASGTSNALTLTVTAPPAGFFEPFEADSKTSYTTGTVTLATGQYNFVDALLGTSTDDRKNNTRSARLQAGSVTMSFDKANGAGTITLQAANFGTDTGGRLVVSVSTDGGATFTAYASAQTTLTSTLATYTFTANVPGSIRVRLSNPTGSGSTRINIDDLQITDYSGPACVAPTSVAANSITGTSASVSFTGDASATSYTATATPTTGSPVTATGTTSPISLTGLTAGTTYSLTVTSTCSGGGSATSTPAVSFSTPAAPVNPQIAISQGGTGYASGNAYGFTSTVAVGSSSTPVQFTITNAGPDALTIGSFVASGSEFVTSGTNPTTVAANGGTATFNVVFTPSATGSRSGSITINNNSSATPAFVLIFNGTATATPAAAFATGNLVVARVGTGTGSLGSAAMAVFLDEYTTTTSNTAPVRSVALPTADASGNQTLTLPGSGTSVGALLRSPDGQYLTIGGFDAATGTNAVANTTAATVNRTVARIDKSLVINVTTALTDAYSTDNIRSAVTSNGTNIWTSGNQATATPGTGGIRYTTLGTTTSTLVSGTVTNTRVTDIFGGQLYYSTGSGTQGVYRLGTNRPTTAGAAATLIAAVNSPYGFVMLERDNLETGLDVLYVVDDGSGSANSPGIYKFSKSGTTWTARGRVTISSGYRGLTGRLNGNTVELYLTSGTTLSAFIDATSKDVSLTGAATLVTLATAANNTAFRGISFAPEPVDLIVDASTGPLNVDGGAYRDIYVDDILVSTSALSATGTVVLDDDGSFDPSNSPLTGTASFSMPVNSIDQTGLLVIRHPQGLSLTGATGQIQVTGTRSYGGSYGNFSFSNTTGTPQVTGPGFPDIVSNITNFATSDVTLSRPLSVRRLVQIGTNNIQLNGQALTLLSTANPGLGGGSGQAQVTLSGATTANVIGTTATVQRAIRNTTPIAYRHYSSPVQSETLGTLATAGFSPVFNQAYNTSADPSMVAPFPTVFGYDETRLRPAANGGSPATTFANAFDKGWVVPAATTPWTPGTGYTVNISRTALVDFTGQVNTGLIERTGLGRTNADGGWHLLGNPYPQAIDMSSATQNADPTSTATLAGMDAAIYVYEASSQYGGSYRAFVNGVGIGQVAVAQGFFVRTSAVGTSGTVRFTNSLRSGNESGAPFRQVDARPLLRLAVADAAATLTDNATVYFDATATATFDAKADAYKLTNPSGLTLGTVLTNGESLSIDGRPSLATQTQIIPLTLSVPQAGTYTFSVESFANLGGATVVLRDALTGTRTVLAAGSSYRASLAGTSATGRFALEFQPAAAPLATNAQALAAQVQLYPNPTASRFHLSLPLGATVKPVAATLTNALGQTVLSRTLTTAEADFDVRGLAAGVYMLRLNLEGTQVVRRVVVQ